MSRLDPSLTQIADDAFIAEGTTVVGDVHIGSASSVWFGTVMRGDVEKIRIGARTNIQDNSVVHADVGFPCVIGDDVTVGHRCIVHGAQVGDGALIGMGAIVMNGAKIGARSLVAAGALVPEGKEFPEGVLIMGAPAKVKRELNEMELESLKFSSSHYVANGQEYRRQGFGRKNA